MTFDACLNIDVRKLRRWGIMGAVAAQGWRVLRWTRGGQSAGSVRVRASGAGHAVELAYATPDEWSGQWLPTQEVVRLDHTHCGFGGTRPWFLCPRCGRRCAVIVIPGPKVRRRVCARLPYAVQREPPLARMRRQIDRLEDRLPNGIRPRWMRRRTYRRLRAELDALEDEHAAEPARIFETLERGPPRPLPRPGRASQGPWKAPDTKIP